MINIMDVRQAVDHDPIHWKTFLYSFVDDFRCFKSFEQISEYIPSGDKYDKFIASTIEYLCDELGIDHPEWTYTIGRLDAPWFCSGLPSMVAWELVESPVQFRRRDIFVSKDVMSRV